MYFKQVKAIIVYECDLSNTLKMSAECSRPSKPFSLIDLFLKDRVISSQSRTYSFSLFAVEVNRWSWSLTDEHNILFHNTRRTSPRHQTSTSPSDQVKLHVPRFVCSELIRFAWYFIETWLSHPCKCCHCNPREITTLVDGI